MVTNWGEIYNRESMYETVRENLLDGDKVKINGKVCQSLIDVMMEDLRMEIDKEEYYLRQAEKAWESNDDRSYHYNFSQSIQRGTITDYLIGRLKGTVMNSKQAAVDNNKIESDTRRLKKIDKCSLEELQKILEVLKNYQINAVNYQIDGDGVNVLTSKLLRKIELIIQKVEKEIYYRQIDYSDEKEC